jgi:glutamyl-tRNA reductase
MIECRLITHDRFSLEAREQLLHTFCPEGERPHVFLKTCNRMELYWGDGGASDEIVRHLYRVASGLESGLTGERAIQGQLKNAYLDACARYKLSPQLHRLFQTAMHTGKRVRSETRISEGAVSHSQVTVAILKESQLDLRERVVSIIGVNKLTEDILKFLTDKQAVNVFLSNRNFEKARLLATQYGGTAMPLDEKRRMLAFTDVLICATAAPHILVGAEDIPPDKEMLLFDLAFPRDIDPALGARENIRLYDLEEIEAYARTNRSLRNNSIQAAEQIIEEEIIKFNAWSHYLHPITTP